MKGPLHADLPNFEPIGDELTLPVLLKVGDNLSTDEIVAGGVKGGEIVLIDAGVTDASVSRTRLNTDMDG